MKKIVALMVIVFVMGCTDKTVNFTVDFYDNFDYYTSFPVGPWYSNNACSAKLVDGSVSIGKGKPCLYLDLNGINYTLSIDYKGNGSIFFGIKNDSYYELKLGSWNLTFCNKTCTYVADVQDMYDEKWHNVRIVFMDSGIQVY
ncbi:MAG TPA: hypothetical protein ENK81_02855, partial [Euryarchaeota archaeon]|nr:hypothetical protein [Euryarchaeota archaeon]